MSFIAWLVIGALAGWLTGLIMKGTGYSWPVNIGLGIVGSMVGGWLGGMLLGIDLTTGFNLTTLVTSVVGAIIVVLLYRLITRRSLTR